MKVIFLFIKSINCDGTFVVMSTIASDEPDGSPCRPKCGVLEGARAAFPAESRHDACSSFSSKVSLEYGGPDVGRVAVAAQVQTKARQPPKKRIVMRNTQGPRIIKIFLEYL